MNHKKIKNILGFSLLEVMIAMLLLALSLTSLMIVQSRTTKMAIEARNISLATQFAKLQLIECKKKTVEKITAVSDFSLEGDFAEYGYENFSWECHAPKFNLQPPSAAKIDQFAKNEVKKAGEDSKKPKFDASSAGSIIPMITNALNESVRELTVIVRFKDGNNSDEVRVTTHVVDLSVAAGLSRMIGAQMGNLGNSKEPKKDKDKDNKENVERR